MSEINEIAKGIKSKKFEGNGVQFRCKIIGMEDLRFDLDEKLCLESIFRLKAIVRARGEHKQRIQLNLTVNGVKVIDEATKVQIADHEVTRISYVILDPGDIRAFGYIYNTSDGRHQFWAIKTERSAVVTVIAFKDLFETVMEQFKNSEKAKAETNQPTSTFVLPEPSTVSIQQSSLTSSSASTPQPPVISVEPVSKSAQASTTPSFANVWGDSPSAMISQTASAPKTFSFDDTWGNSPSATVLQTTSTSKTPLFHDAWGDSPSTTISPTPSISKNPLFDNIWGDAPPTMASQITPAPKTVLCDDVSGNSSSKTVSQTPSAPKTPAFDNVWGDSLSTTIPRPTQTAQQPSTPNINPWNINEPVMPIIQQASRVENVRF
ncbi:unnamed protein product [Rotaria sp. Silwood1]|nr:unnamed protein product [Rotaria sp. Silwood1]CAF1109995.1 unnamed protein product [Rotaria sp. Silwood1]